MPTEKDPQYYIDQRGRAVRYAASLFLILGFSLSQLKETDPVDSSNLTLQILGGVIRNKMRKGVKITQKELK
jgi:hypothetical protein